MSNSTELLNLPNDVLATILSNLDLQETLVASEVCKRLNDVTALPSVWKRVSAEVNSERNLLSFCEFFTERHFVEELYLIHISRFSRRFSQSEIDHINDLLGRLPMLRDLCADFDLFSINIPHQLKRLYINNISTARVNRSAFCNTKFPNSLQVLSIRGKFPSSETQHNRETNTEIKNLLEKNESTLTTLSLDIEEFKNQGFEIDTLKEAPSWLPQIMCCLNLKKLKFSIVATPDELKSLFSSISKLPLLEVLHLRFVIEKRGYFENIPNSDVEVFIKLKELFINCDWFELGEFATDNSFPNLETFSLVDVNRHSCKPFLQFIRGCDNLKHIRYSGLKLSSVTINFLLTEFTYLKQHKNYKSICLCSILKYKSSSDSETRRKKIEEKLSLLSCNQKIFGRHCSPNCHDYFFGNPFQKSLSITDDE